MFLISAARADFQSNRKGPPILPIKSNKPPITPHSPQPENHSPTEEALIQKPVFNLPNKKSPMPISKTRFTQQATSYQADFPQPPPNMLDKPAVSPRYNRPQLLAEPRFEQPHYSRPTPPHLKLNNVAIKNVYLKSPKQKSPFMQPSLPKKSPNRMEETITEASSIRPDFNNQV